LQLYRLLIIFVKNTKVKIASRKNWESRGAKLLWQGLLRHRRFSVANASYAKTSQERELKAKRDWLTLTAEGTESLLGCGAKPRKTKAKKLK